MPSARRIIVRGVFQPISIVAVDDVRASAGEISEVALAAAATTSSTAAITLAAATTSSTAAITSSTAAITSAAAAEAAASATEDAARCRTDDPLKNLTTTDRGTSPSGGGKNRSAVLRSAPPPAPPLPGTLAAQHLLGRSPRASRITDAGPLAPAGKPQTASAAETATGSGDASAKKISASASASKAASASSPKMVPQSQATNYPCVGVPGQRLFLSDPADQHHLSNLFCFVRWQIEIFPSTELDVIARNKKGGIRYPIKAGRVGLRCRWCANLPHHERPNGSSSYPNSIRLVHQSVRNWQRHHLMMCPSIPQSVKNKAKLLGMNRKHSNGHSNEYWMQSCERKGMYDNDKEDGGIRLRGFDYSKVDDGVAESQRARAIAEAEVVEAVKKTKRKMQKAATGGGCRSKAARRATEGGDRSRNGDGAPVASGVVVGARDASDVAQALLNLSSSSKGIDKQGSTSN